HSDSRSRRRAACSWRFRRRRSRRRRPARKRARLRCPHLDSQLLRLSDRLPLQREAELAATMPLSDGTRVAVGIRIDGNASVAGAAIAAVAGQPLHVFDGFAEAYVPVSQLARLGGWPGVLSVAPLEPPRAKVTYRAPAIHNSTAWVSNGQTGAGVK